MGRGLILLVTHPALESRSRALFPFGVSRPPAGFAERARAIVTESDLLIACPRQPHGEERSGTWDVMRYARAKRKRVVVVRPGERRS